MLKKVTLLYVLIFGLTIISGVYFVFATSQVVTLTAVVPGEISVANNSATTSQILSWSHSVVTNIENTPTKTEQSVPLKSLGSSSFLTEFSTMVYWYKRENPPPAVDLNSDGRVNIVDFSILAYNGGISL